MAKLDVYRTQAGDHLVDVQSDLLDHFHTRLVVPLLDPVQAPQAIARLNPAFSINGQLLVFYPQFALAVPVAELTHRVTSLAEHQFTITGAIDMLLSGY